MLCTLCTYKGSSLNLELMLSGNYDVIVIIFLFICVYMYVCMYFVSDRVVMDLGCLILNVYMYICAYVCRCLKGRWFFSSVNDYVYVSMCLCHCLTGLLGIILVEEWLLMQENGMKRFLAMRNQVAEYPWQIYEVNIMWIWFSVYACIALMFMLRKSKVGGYIREVKVAWSATC